MAEQLDLFPPPIDASGSLSFKELPPPQVLAALRGALSLLRKNNLTPFHLYAYAVALDGIETRDMFNADVGEGEPRMSTRDALDSMCEMSRDDPGDEIDDLYNLAVSVYEHVHGAAKLDETGAAS